MATVALKPLGLPATPDGYTYFDQITFGGGSPPDRPHPEPPLGIWGPNDPRPTLPIAGWNPDGSWGPKPPVGGGGGGTPGVALPYPPSLPAPPKPEGLPADFAPVLVFYPGEKYPAVGWVGPYPSSGPVPVPPPVPAPA